MEILTQFLQSSLKVDDISYEMDISKITFFDVWFVIFNTVGVVGGLMLMCLGLFDEDARITLFIIGCGLCAAWFICAIVTLVKLMADARAMLDPLRKPILIEQ